MPRWPAKQKNRVKTPQTSGTQEILKSSVLRKPKHFIDTGIRFTPRATYEEPIADDPGPTLENVMAGIGEIRPSYYGCGDVHEVYKCLMAWGLKANAHLWTAVVYLSRAGKKDPAKYVEDLEKAMTWIQIEIREAKAYAERTRTVGDPIGPRN